MLFRGVLTYRLTLYYLASLVGAAIALAFLGIIPYSPLNLLFSAFLLLSACWTVNWIFARAFGAASSAESVCISALILTLIITPVAPDDGAGIGFLVFAAAWAMASKYMLTVSKRHIFNPAAFGAALVGITLHRSVSWWVGDNAVLLPLIIAGGILILARLRYYELVLSFAVVVLGMTLVNTQWQHAGTSLSLMLLHSMFFFFAFVMLTEPRTAPLGRWRQIASGAVTGLLFFPGTHIARYYFTPEVAVLAGNIFSFFSNRRRVHRWSATLRLKIRVLPISSR
jgi:Na+-transporting NADH:ubiquinone oxidoreductase subunit NqrB